MNRNVESHFSIAPQANDVRRSQFDRSSSVKFSGIAGKIYPFYFDEILPGDSVSIDTSKIVRLQTLVHPIMDNIYLDTYWFFVPWRLVWDHWKQFMGESPDAWTPDVEYTVPRLKCTPSHYPQVGGLADAFGIPPQVRSFEPSEAYPEDGLNALPFRAYAKIMADWFRDTSLMDEPVIYTGDETQTMNDPDDEEIYCALGGPLYSASKYHDYFTSGLPSPQRGDPVTINPLKDFIPVASNDGVHEGRFDGSTAPLYWSSTPNGSNLVHLARTNTSYPPAEGSNTDAVYRSDDVYTMYPRNLYADLRDSFALTINDLRTAFQVQRFMEKTARSGNRYIEIIKGMFGIQSPDARLQRSEYLGGNRIALNIREVTNNAQAEQAFLGDLGAYSRTVDNHSDFTKSFTEHGALIGCCVVRYDHTYGQGIPKEFSRFTKYDYYWPVFASLSEQPILRQELWFNSVDPDYNKEVFAYQEAWSEYRFKPNRVFGEMRPGVTNSLASWHLADYYDGDSVPYLSAEWIREDPTQLDRCLVVDSDNADQFFCDFYIKADFTRVMPVYSIPGLIDHH